MRTADQIKQARFCMLFFPKKLSGEIVLRSGMHCDCKICSDKQKSLKKSSCEAMTK